MKTSSEFREKLFLVVLAGVLGLIGVGVTARVTYTGSLEAVDRSLAKAAEQEQAKQRSEVYRAFLDASSDYRYKSIEAQEAVAKTKVGAEPPEAISSWLTARNTYQGTVNDIFTFGSDKAISIVEDIAGTLPRAVGLTTDDDMQALRVYDAPEAYSTYFNKMLDRLCLEVRIGDDQSCSS